MISIQKAYKHKKIEGAGIFNILILLVLATELLTPFLIWKGILPEYFRWVSHAAIAAMMIIAYTRMMVFGWVPGAMWLVAGISVIGVTEAIVVGQDLVPTAWGWWLLFQFPFVGLFAYMQPVWPKKFPELLLKLCIFILIFQVIIQFGQYFAGEPPGDNLAGIFGYHGTGRMSIFILFVYSLALGEWLATKKWKLVILVIGLGSLSSVLGEVKFFILAAVVMSILTIIIYISQYKRLISLLPFVFFIGVGSYVFMRAYNTIVPAAQKRPIELYIQSPTLLFNYLNTATQKYRDGYMYYDMGRNFAVDYGWNTIQEDTQTFFFGYGLGARGESKTLGTVGTGIQRGSLGIVTGTSLLVFMQELGVFGLTTLVLLYLWLMFSIQKLIKADPKSGAQSLRYGLLLFSLLWPLWFWYNTVWINRLPMLLFWIALGYTFGRGREIGMTKRNNFEYLQE